MDVNSNGQAHPDSSTQINHQSSAATHDLQNTSELQKQFSNTQEIKDSSNDLENSRKTGSQQVSKRRVQNIVIDIESEELTYNQARSIRLQIQRDVEQLRNRVRMLEQEEMRAMKKINETRKKTRQIQELQEKNDETFKRRLIDQQKREMMDEREKRMLQEKRMKSQKDVRVRTTEIQQQKLSTVMEVRNQKHQIQHNLLEMKEENAYKANERKRQIIQDRRQGINRQNEFIRKKVEDARVGIHSTANNLKSQINQYETEAQQLERMEAELLQKLQETQKAERDAFGRLESAMVEASIPKSMRRGGLNKSESGGNSGHNSGVRRSIGSREIRARSKA